MAPNVAVEVEDAVAAMGEVTARFPDACLAGVPVNEISTAAGYEHAEAVATNEPMRGKLDVTATSATPEGLLSDGIHANELGQAALVNAVQEDINSCAA